MFYPSGILSFVSRCLTACHTDFQPSLPTLCCPPILRHFCCSNSWGFSEVPQLEEGQHIKFSLNLQFALLFIAPCNLFVGSTRASILQFPSLDFDHRTPCLLFNIFICSCVSCKSLVKSRDLCNLGLHPDWTAQHYLCGNALARTLTSGNQNVGCVHILEGKCIFLPFPTSLTHW